MDIIIVILRVSGVGRLSDAACAKSWLPPPTTQPHKTNTQHYYFFFSSSMDDDVDSELD
jgi:hypothetical protein